MRKRGFTQVAEMLCRNGFKNDEKEMMEVMREQKVTQMIKSAEVNASLLHKISKPTAWRRAQILEKGEEDARLMDRCEAKMKE